MSDFVTEFEDFSIGDVIDNPDVGKFVVVAINAKAKRTLLLSTNPNVRNRYIGAWLLTKRPDGDGYYWQNGHYFGSDAKAAMEYVLDLQPPELKKDDIVIIVDTGMVTDVFSTGNHVVDIIDLDCCNGYDEREELEYRADEIRNSDEYKSIY